MVADKVRHISFTIKDANVFSAPAIGTAKVPVAEVAPGKVFDGWLELINEQDEVVQKKDIMHRHETKKVALLCCCLLHDHHLQPVSS